jgi:plastocyanin/predicted membrane protein
MATTAADTHDHDAADGTARWARLASLGLTMVAAGPLVMLVASLLWGNDVGDDLLFFVLPIVFGIVGSVLVRQPRTLWRVLGIVAGLLGAVMVFWTIFGLATPNSVFDFVPGLLVIPGFLIALIAGIAAVRAQRRGAVTATPEGGERRAILAICAVVGLLSVGSAVLSITSRDTVSDADAASADVRVDLKDFEFDNDAYDISGGGTILVKNSDPFLHTFTVDALGIDVTMTPGSEELVVIPAKPGDYVLYCDPHTSDPEDPSEDDMAARLTVD